ncbi:hypothetical protein [Microcoleus sp. FACHB-672]|uniref:hypothetical protein n=1 Tax=Microcoleus sp. FACHB-672 TaxID=2692825 RepID=UPI001681F540|nr:hypothetical protein [Microcoleus sp. FACHB-672]MBD2041876.1 hypothetical protein [Microcoleus sp. FACHB-672]
MNTYLLNLFLFSQLSKAGSKGFTTFDLLAHIFVIVILLMAVPVLFFSPQPGSDTAYQGNQTVLIRFKY